MYWRWNVLNFIRRNALSFTPFLRKYVMITLMCYNDSATYDWKGNARGIFIILAKVKPFTDYNESNFEDFLSPCSPNFKMTDTRLQKRLFRVRKMHMMKHSQVACFKIVLKKKKWRQFWNLRLIAWITIKTPIIPCIRSILSLI